MKKLLIILLVIVSCILVITPRTEAQSLYTGIYWIMGKVLDPDNVGTEGRQVCFFKEIANDAIIGGYADELVGPVGTSGRADEYMMNAYEDYRLAIAPGKYYVAIVNDNPSDMANGYGADKVPVTVTANGWDTAPDLVLAKGAGILPPADRPDPMAALLPRIEDIYFGKRKYQKVLVEEKDQEFIVPSQPRISANAVSEYGLIVSQIAMVVGEGTANAKTYSINASDIVQSSGPPDSPTLVSFVIDMAKVGDVLPEGEIDIDFKAANVFGSTSETCTVTVAGGKPRLIGIPITYPSPLHLISTTQVIFQYTLSHNMNLDLYLFDVTGRVAKRYTINEGEEGGSAGVNKVTWNLMTDQGQKVSSGIYVFTLVNRDTKKLLGKGKFTALP